MHGGIFCTVPVALFLLEGAQIELPHIMILIDDTEKTVIEPLAEKTGGMEKLYDFKLMQNGGSIKGWLLDEKSADNVLAALEKLADLDSFNKKYGISETSPLVYAMGDGNHSLATAKEYYERLKAKYPDKDMAHSPARYALAEIVDLHSPALEFEAIHRIVTGVDAQKLEEKVTEELELSDSISAQKIVIVKNGVHKEKYVHKPLSKLAVGSLQTVLDRLLPEAGGKNRLYTRHGSCRQAFDERGYDRLYPAGYGEIRAFPDGHL